MFKQSIGFIGGGRIVRIILEGWRRAGALPSSAVVSDNSEAALAQLKGAVDCPQLRTIVGGNADAARQDVVFLAVHPPVLADVAQSIKPVLRHETLVISLAPKFTIAKLGAMLGTRAIARAIPNAPSIVNAGFNPIAFGPALSTSDRQLIAQLFTPLGECPVVAEESLEAYALLSGMGPTYFWFQFYALLELAREFGLSPTAAAAALETTVQGALKTMRGSELPANVVQDLVPVRPIADAETLIIERYRAALRGLMERIKP